MDMKDFIQQIVKNAMEDEKQLYTKAFREHITEKVQDGIKILDIKLVFEPETRKIVTKCTIG